MVVVAANPSTQKTLEIDSPHHDCGGDLEDDCGNERLPSHLAIVRDVTSPHRRLAISCGSRSTRPA